MRAILLIVLLLLAVGTCAAVVETGGQRADSTPGTATLEWVRTSQGWQRPATWRRVPARFPRLHPLVVAGLIAMGGVAVLLAAASPRQPSGG